MSTSAVANQGALPGAEAAGTQIARNYVAEVAALAIGDAVDYVRNLETISLAAQGVAIEKILAEQNPLYVQVITAAQEMVTEAIAVIAAVTGTASEAVSSF